MYKTLQSKDENTHHANFLRDKPFENIRFILTSVTPIVVISLPCCGLRDEQCFFYSFLFDAQKPLSLMRPLAPKCLWTEELILPDAACSAAAAGSTGLHLLKNSCGTLPQTQHIIQMWLGFFCPSVQRV